MDKNLKRKINSIYNEKYALSNYAFSFYLFTERLYRRLVEEKITNVFFLSREGRFLSRLFNEYLDYKNVKNEINVEYLFVSRKAVICGSLKEIEKESFNAFRRYPFVSVNDFLAGLDFSLNEKEMVLDKFELDPDEKVTDFFNSKEYQEIQSNDIFQDIYETKRIIEYEALEKYLSKVNIRGNKKIAVVDVGWNGTIQNELEKHCNNMVIKGFYLGIYKNDNNKEGLLFNPQDRNAFSFNNYIYEYVCVADHGPTKSYDSAGCPVLEIDEDKELYDIYFKTIQDMIIAKFKKICICEVAACESNSFEKHLERLHARQLLTFSKEEKRIIASSRNIHPDNFMQIDNRHVGIKHYLYKLYWNCKLFYKVVV